MFTNALNIVFEEAQNLVSEIRQDLSSKRIDDTGEASNSLRVEKSSFNVKVFAISYLEFLDRGRGPGKFPPVNKMREWVKSKLGIDDNSIAYLIGKKISEEGTNIYRNKSKGIEFDQKVENMIKRINERLPAAIKLDVQNQLRGAFVA